MENLEVVFEDNKELSEDEVVMAMYEEGEASLKDCQTLYKKLATEAGLIVSPAQKKALWEEAAADLDYTLAEDIKAAKKLGEDLDIGAATITKYVKAIAEEQGIDLPVVERNSTWQLVVDAFTEDEALGATREEVVAKIAEVGGHTEEKANGMYNRLRKAFGWEAPASMSSQLNSWFIDNREATREEVIAAGVEVGMSEGSASYYHGVYKIVNELVEAIQTK